MALGSDVDPAASYVSAQAALADHSGNPLRNQLRNRAIADDYWRDGLVLAGAFLTTSFECQIVRPSGIRSGSVELRNRHAHQPSDDAILFDRSGNQRLATMQVVDGLREPDGVVRILDGDLGATVDSAARSAVAPLRHREPSAADDRTVSTLTVLTGPSRSTM